MTLGTDRQTPVISVVMAVFNGAATLARTLDALRPDEGPELEIIVVDDGSTDATPGMLDRWQVAGPNRRVIHQSNQGLTAALIAGCRLARGKYIARQDAGDISLPGRLPRQRRELDADPDVVMVSSGVRFVDPDGEELYRVVMDDDQAMAGLSAEDGSSLRGPPHHGSVMFRISTYREAGEYRAEFRVAQDLDLWTRMVERGRHVRVSDLLYQADSSPGAISFTRPGIQRAAIRLILEAGERRRRGESEMQVLDEARRLTRGAPLSRRLAQSGYHYFVAGCLRQSRPEKAARHYRQAIGHDPLHWRAWMRWIQLLFARWNRPSAGK